MDLSLGSDLTCWRASCKFGSGGLSVRFSRVVELSSVGLTGYARTGVRQSTKTKSFMRRSRALRCGSIIVGYSVDAKEDEL